MRHPTTIGYRLRTASLLALLLSLILINADINAQTVGPSEPPPPRRSPGSDSQLPVSTKVTLQSIDLKDGACTSIPNPEKTIKLVYCGRATGDGDINLATIDFGVDPADVGVFEASAPAKTGMVLGFGMTYLIQMALLPQTSLTWNPLGASYDPTTKNLIFKIKSNVMYSVFQLSADAARTTKPSDTGGGVVSSNNNFAANSLTIGVGILLLTSALSFVVYRKNGKKRLV